MKRGRRWVALGAAVCAIFSTACASAPRPKDLRGASPAATDPTGSGPVDLGQRSGDGAVSGPSPEQPAQARPLQGPREDRIPLPRIPALSGPLDIAVRYPARNQRIEPDSNFIFGSVGTGGASLEINGRTVVVEPNGAFLAWLEVPPVERGDTAFYRLTARAAELQTELVLPIRRPPSDPPPGAERPWVAASGVGLRPERWVRPGELALFEWMGEGGSTLRLTAGDATVPLASLGPARGSLERYGAAVDLSSLRQAACRAGRCRRAAARPSEDGAPTAAVAVDTVSMDLWAGRDGRERRREIRVPTAVIEPGREPAVRLREATDRVNGQSGVIVARATPFGPYRWRLAEGTVAPVTGRWGDRLRIRLVDGLEAWVLGEDTEWAAPVRTPAVTWDARAVASADPERVSLRVGLSRPAAAEVTLTGERSLALTIFDAHGRMGRIAHGGDTGIAAIRWSQLDGPRVRLDLELDWPVWGYRLSIESGEADAYEGPRAGFPRADGDEGPAVLRLDIRRPPDIDPAAPLTGRTIAIDPGHPGAGSYGPTGYFEGDANLAVARRLASMLRDAGALPVLMRDGRGAVGLYERTRRAREAGAELFVSIHNNALPDGVRPSERAGTSTFYYHPHSAQLAAAVQRGLVSEMGLENRGVLWGDLAVVREPWMPAVLAEGAFMMIPQHEAALRQPEFQSWYARGVLLGLEAFLAGAAERIRSEDR